jgi:hypothetical protein
MSLLKKELQWQGHCYWHCLPPAAAAAAAAVLIFGTLLSTDRIFGSGFE